MKQSCSRIPNCSAFPFGPAPIASGGKEYPCPAPERCRKMGDHRIRTNHHVQCAQAACQCHDVRRANVDRPDFVRGFGGLSTLQRPELRARRVQPLELADRKRSPAVPITGAPDQANRQLSGVLRCSRNRAAQASKVWAPRLELMARRLDRMGNLHDLDVDVERDIRRSIVQGNGPVDAGCCRDQWNQFGLAPDDHFTRDHSQRTHETDKLNRVPKSVIAANQDPLAAQPFTAPDPLLMARPLMLRKVYSADSCQIAIRDRPCPIEIARTHGVGPLPAVTRAARIRWRSGHSQGADERWTNL